MAGQVVVIDEGRLRAMGFLPNTPGAIPAGTRIRKVAAEEGDEHPVGTEGVVIASVAANAAIKADPGVGHIPFAYMVKFDKNSTVQTILDAPTFIVSTKIEEIA